MELYTILTTVHTAQNNILYSVEGGPEKDILQPSEKSCGNKTSYRVFFDML